MEIVEEGTKMMAKKKQKLAIEDYLDFIDDRALKLTVNQLRQIISMHGFKMAKTQKSILKDIITTMDLMDLHRSTLLEGDVSGDACFKLGEVINDLKDLNWQECHATSLLNQGAVVSAASSEGFIVSQKRKRFKGIEKAIEVEVDHSVLSTRTTVAAGSTTESLRSMDCNSSQV